MASIQSQTNTYHLALLLMLLFPCRTSHLLNCPFCPCIQLDCYPAFARYKKLHWGFKSLGMIALNVRNCHTGKQVSDTQDHDHAHQP